MTHLGRGDRDLHDENEEHRSTCPFTNGMMLASYERRIRRHLEEHAAH